MKIDTKDARFYAAAVGLISAGLLAGAHYFQYVEHLLPCELCYWQRFPHFALVPLAALAFLWRQGRPFVLGVMGLTALGNAGIAIFHVGVEYHWWEGLTACSAPTVRPTTLEEARKIIFESRVVPCDKALWHFLGLSMAGWNGVASLVQTGLAGFGAGVAWQRAKRIGG